MITYSNIVTKFEEFVSNHFFLKTFSHGSPSDVDLDKFEVYPLLHLVYTGGGYDSNVKTYNLEVYILDSPPRDEDKTDFQKQVISASEQAAEDILADIENGGNIFQFGYDYDLQSAQILPLEDERSNVLAGTMLSLSIGVAYTYDSCNAPLTGVEPEGTDPQPFRARGLLRVRELDGTPDVLSVATINVPNGSLVDDGEGEITLTFGGGGDADTAEKIHFPIRNDEGATIAAGTPLYSRGEIGNSERVLVGIADASDPAKMPAIAIAETELTTTGNGKDGFGIVAGTYNTNLSGFTGLQENDILYVAEGGGLHQDKPTGTNLIQNVGVVLKTNGTICQGLKVSCIGRTNDVPNLPDGKFFIGSATNTETSAYGLPTSDPSDNETLVYNSASDAFEAGYPISTGQQTIFQRFSPSTQRTLNIGLNAWDFGSLLGGGVTFDNAIRAGAAFGFAQVATTLQASPITVDSDVQVEVKYEITLDTAGLCIPSVTTKTGFFGQVAMTFPNHTAAGTTTHTITSNTSQALFYQISNTLAFQFFSNVTGSYRIHYIKVTIDHA